MNKKAKETEGLQVGNRVPDFRAEDQFGGTFTLSEALKKGPLVLVFYRGRWCPICNSHLKKLENGLSSISAKGANVVAISPETAEYLKKTAQKTKASFPLLHDKNYAISDLFELTFRPGFMERVMYNTILGAQLKKAHSDDSQRLPIPATYIVDTDRTVVWRHFNPDFKKRSSVEEILNHIPN